MYYVADPLNHKSSIASTTKKKTTWKPTGLFIARVTPKYAWNLILSKMITRLTSKPLSSSELMEQPEKILSCEL